MADIFSLNDVEFVKEIKRGNNVSQEKFVARYGPCLRGFVKKHFAEISDLDVEEIIQDTFYKAIKNMQKYQPEKGAKFSTWVFEIAKNTAMDWRRKNAKHNCLVYDREDLQTAGERPQSEEISKEGKIMREALSHLDPIERQILEWNSNDISLAEIARDYLHIEEGTVRQRKKRALEKLKKIYTELKDKGRTEGRKGIC